MTTNNHKYIIGKEIFNSYGLSLIQEPLDIDEIQSDDSVKITLDKVRKAYDALQKPVIVTDDSWSLPALNGFPGPYMKYVEQHFTPDDFLRLLEPMTDRSVILNRTVVYFNGQKEQVFQHAIKGSIAHEPRGESGITIAKIATLDIDNGLTLAEVYDKNKALHKGRLAAMRSWHELVKWLQENNL